MRNFLMPFYAWQRHSLTYTYRLAVDKPITTNVLYNVGQYGYIQASNSGVPDWMMMTVPMPDTIKEMFGIEDDYEKSSIQQFYSSYYSYERTDGWYDFRDGYVFRYFNESNMELLKKIASYIKPEILIPDINEWDGTKEMNEFTDKLNDLYERDVDYIISEYTTLNDQSYEEGAREQINSSIISEMKNLGFKYVENDSRRSDVWVFSILGNKLASLFEVTNSKKLSVIQMLNKKLDGEKTDKKTKDRVVTNQAPPKIVPKEKPDAVPLPENIKQIKELLEKRQNPVKVENLDKQTSEFEKKEIFDPNKISALIDKSKKDNAEIEKKTSLEATQSQQKNVVVSKLTITQEDAIKAQIFKCWNIPIGLPYNENLTVKVRLKLNPDGSLISSEILDQSRMNAGGQTYYKVLAESALRAVKLCNPLKVPPTEYEKWKEMQLNFDAKEMLRG